jgi:hypothetical protein
MRKPKRRQNTTLSLQIDPAILLKAQRLARRGRRSIAALVEFLVEQEIRNERRKILRSVAHSKRKPTRK